MVKKKEIYPEDMSYSEELRRRPMYHGTSCTFAEEIMEKGLLIGCKPHHKECRGKKGVFLTKLPYNAMMWGLQATKDEVNFGDLQNICVFEVNCLVDDKAIIKTDGYGEWMTNKSVPPRCLILHTPDDMRASLKFSPSWDMVRKFGEKELE